MLTEEEIEIGRAYDILLVRLANYGMYVDGEIIKKSKKDFLLSLDEPKKLVS